MNKAKHPTSGGAALRSCYRRGQRYLKLLQGTDRPWRCDQCRTCLQEGVRLLALSKIDPGFRIADALAEEYGIDRKQMRQECYFTAAVDTVAVYCGDDARDFILQGHQYLGIESVLQISRTAPPRQRYAMEQVREGRHPLATNGKGCPVYDTVDFKEVISRLRRTQGKIGVSLLAVARLPKGTRPSAEDHTKMTTRLNGIISDTREIMDVTAAAPLGQPCPCDLAAGKRWSQVRQDNKAAREFPPSYRAACGLLGQSQGFTRKCVRDMPQLLGEVRPLRQEKDDVQRRGAVIVREAGRLLQMLPRRAAPEAPRSS